jgi:uncharacterized RDD family membrane protein YckC
MTNEHATAQKPMSATYVLAMVVLTIVSYALYSFLPAAVGMLMSGSLPIMELTKATVPEVHDSVMWGDKLVVPLIEVNTFNPTAVSHALAVYDLETRKSKVIPTNLPGAGVRLRMVEDGPVLWCLNGASVSRIEGESITTTTTGMTIGTETPFRYQGKLAVIVESRNRGTGAQPVFNLYTWTGAAWNYEGRVAVPHPIAGGEGGQSFQYTGTADVRVVNDGDKLHVFCSDRRIVLYSTQLEVLPDGAASALDAENGTPENGGWVLARMAGLPQVGVDSQGPIIVGYTQTAQGLSMTTVTVARRPKGDEWEESARTTRAGFILDPQLVFNGRQALVVNMTIASKLQVHNMTDPAKPEIGLHLQTAEAANRLSKFTQDSWWVQIPIALIYAWIASRMMSASRGNHYEFGNRTVELASLFRRALAKLLDAALMGSPFQIALFASGMSMGDLNEKSLEIMTSLDGKMVTTIALFVLGLVIYYLLWLLGLGYSEGKWGVTPGKWVCGIRTVRTTLRPCGFARAVLRMLILVLDGICCGWLPGVICMAFTSCRQRIGDLASDTIVVRWPMPAAEVTPTAAVASDAAR